MDFEIKTEKMPDNLPGIVPFLMNEEFGKTYFEVYEGLCDIAKEFVSKTGGSFFTNSALDYLFSKVSNKLEGSGYTLDRYGKYRYCYEMRITKVNEDVILNNTEKMSKKFSKTENLTSIFAEEDGSIPELSFVVIEDGKIVSAATVNDNMTSSLAEITVSTAPSYRNKGYGASSVAALSKYLLKKGLTPVYCVSRYNTKSLRLAEKCGFEKVGRFYALAAYRD